jgi:lipopolysaccharide/colanic/teichoic acid biosynthesis glycosyltransferase/nucleoside-diphosphate-sugar epimerase
MESAIVGAIDGETDWTDALICVDVVTHLAARVHMMKDKAADPLAVFRTINVDGTLNLARQAAAAMVKRFVFISSVKVNGEATLPGRPFAADDIPAPLDPYGVSKMEAEQGLRQIAAETGMEVVIIRPPLVYGPVVKANFAALMRAVQRGWPLPLGAVHNQRSLVALDNLVDFIVSCMTHPQAANQTFLVSDGQDMSTTELVRGLASAAGVPARLLPVPVWALQAGAALLGKRDAVQRLCGNLQVDMSKARSLLGWLPPVSVEEGLRRVMGTGDGLPRFARNDGRGGRGGRGGRMKRVFDIFLGCLAALILFVPVLFVAIAVRLTSKGPVLYCSDRVGQNNVIFKMPKFRSMRVGTPAVATHLLADSQSHLTPIGSFLRKTSLDELPQLWSILVGNMSFVGPRPALFNQQDLIALRTEQGVHTLVPGLTGWAQVNGRDELPIPEKVKLDVAYLQRQSLWFDVRILWMTFDKVLRRDGVTH